ncbi:hypothetical protein CFC21_104259 [Triticum aestivum]|uniref:Neprosin PEP catalytic domain-containing protein n=2 Tax=Triticum aestivum TaxID=4565 RepID=A0A9R1M9P6_WHEAT|nr:hypothetical protein CFC21_104259 [Triticum aestivum]
MAVVAAAACVVLLLLTGNGCDAARPVTTSDKFTNHQTPRESDQAYYGVIVTMDVYGLHLSDEQSSVSSVWLRDEGDGALSSHNAIEIGWETDGFQKTRCHNTNCTVGFQPANGAPIGLGDVIQTLSQPKGLKQNITLKVIKDDLALIGRFPRTIFTGGMADRASGIRFGGYVSTRTTDLAPMESGYLPTTDVMVAASISNIQFIDRNGQALVVTQDLPTYMSDPNIYAVTPIVDGRFFYGGPLQSSV